MQKTRELLLKLGYSEKSIIKIITNTSLHRYSDDFLATRIPETWAFLAKFNISNKKIIKMTTEAPGIFTNTINHLNDKFNELIKIGYNKQQAIKLISESPICLVYSSEHLKNKINSFIELGYTEQQVIIMSLKLSTLFDLNIETNIKVKIIFLKEQGFSNTQILKMTINHPEIFSYSIPNMSNKLSDIKSLGFDGITIIKLFSEFPNLFGLTTRNITRKINFLKSINVINKIIEKPRTLMHSVELTYARYEFFKNNNLSYEEYELFIANKLFEKKYYITKEDLLKQYNYKEYIEGNKNDKKSL